MPSLLEAWSRVLIRAPKSEDGASFTALARGSRPFHASLITPPRDLDQYATFLQRSHDAEFEAYLLIRKHDQRLLGSVNLSQIVRRGFQNAYVGYWIGAPYARQGFMTEGLALVINDAFRRLRLHRLEANIQPENIPSKRLVQRLGFRQEGLSPKYLKVGGRWRDHERWAILSEEWQARGRRVAALRRR